MEAHILYMYIPLRFVFYTTCKAQLRNSMVNKCYIWESMERMIILYNAMINHECVLPYCQLLKVIQI